MAPARRAVAEVRAAAERPVLVDRAPPPGFVQQRAPAVRARFGDAPALPPQRVLQRGGFHGPQPRLPPAPAELAALGRGGAGETRVRGVGLAVERRQPAERLGPGRAPELLRLVVADSR